MDRECEERMEQLKNLNELDVTAKNLEREDGLVKNNFSVSDQVLLELGTILCRHCNKIIGTLPTRGVKRFYGECHDESCLHTQTMKISEYE